MRPAGLAPQAPRRQDAEDHGDLPDAVLQEGRLMRGRRPSGPSYVDQLPGSELAKERVKVVLETLAGTCRVTEACARLQISEPRFEQLRKQVLLAAVERLEPRTAGRPPQTPAAHEQRLRDLEKQVVELGLDKKLAQTRAEIALVLPNAVHQPAENGTAAPTAAEKKTPPRRCRRRRY
jgi:hypothetical protein